MRLEYMFICMQLLIMAAVPAPSQEYAKGLSMDNDKKNSILTLLNKLKLDIPELFFYRDTAGHLIEVDEDHRLYAWLKQLIGGEIVNCPVRIEVCYDQLESKESDFPCWSNSMPKDSTWQGTIWIYKSGEENDPKPHADPSNVVFFNHWFMVVAEAMNIKNGAKFLNNNILMKQGKLDKNTFIASQISNELLAMNDALDIFDELFGASYKWIRRDNLTMRHKRKKIPSFTLQWVLESENLQKHREYYGRVFEQYSNTDSPH